MNFFRFFSLSLACVFPIVSARAKDELAEPWQLSFSTPASPVMERFATLHDVWLLPLITVISLMVLALLVYIVVKFNSKANPVASRTTHNTKLEVIWTAVPTLIIVIIGIYSWKLHYYVEGVPDDAMTLKVTGYQWFWHYDYPDHGGFGFDSYLIKDVDLKPSDMRLLAVDNRVVVPVDTNIRVQITAGDVLHAWAVQAFGVKRDAVPGRLNETWFRAEREGTFYGQCSELCGVGHGFMPIVVDVVSKEAFATWVASKAEGPATGKAAPATAAPKAATPMTPGKTPKPSPEAAKVSPTTPTTDPAAKAPAKNVPDAKLPPPKE